MYLKLRCRRSVSFNWNLCTSELCKARTVHIKTIPSLIIITVAVKEGKPGTHSCWLIRRFSWAHKCTGLQEFSSLFLQNPSAELDCQQTRRTDVHFNCGMQCIAKPQVHLKWREMKSRLSRSHDYSLFPRPERKYSSDAFHKRGWRLLHVPFFLRISISGWLCWHPEQNATPQNSSRLVLSSDLDTLDLGRNSQEPTQQLGWTAGCPSYFLPGRWPTHEKEAPRRTAVRHGDGEINLDVSLLWLYGDLIPVLPLATSLWIFLLLFSPFLSASDAIFSW